MMSYKNYRALVEYDDEARIFHGEVIGTRDVITFQGSSVEELEREFANSVEDYLAFCAQEGKEPDRTFSGTFNVRIGSDRHLKATALAASKHVSLNDWILEAVDEKIHRDA